MCKPSAEPSLPELCRGEAINRTCKFQFIGHVFYKHQSVDLPLRQINRFSMVLTINGKLVQAEDHKSGFND